MKNLKTTIALCLSLIILSCSKDDDNQIVQEYFPIKIMTSVPASPNLNGSTDIEYDNKSRISKISYINDAQTYEFDLTYNSNDLIEKVVSKKTTASTSSELTFNCNYTDTILTQIQLSNSITSSTIDFIYDSANRKYVIQDSSSGTEYFIFDTNGNLVEFNLVGIQLALTYSNNKGIYNGFKNSLPLLFASMINSSEITFYYSYFFANKDITNMTAYSSNHFTSTSTVNDNNSISGTLLKNVDTGETVLTSNIQYELRTINLN
jgi:hypothetical protein